MTSYSITKADRNVACPVFVSQVTNLIGKSLKRADCDTQGCGM
jgi:hypothetical protein